MANYKKHPKYGHVYGEAIKTPVGRLIWPSLVTPKAPPPPKDGEEQTGTPRYEATLLFENNAATKKFIKSLEVMSASMVAAFNKGAKVKISDVSVIGDGNELDLEKYPMYENKFFLVARNAKREGFDLLDTAKESVAPEAFESGMPVVAVVTPIMSSHGMSYKLNIVKLEEDDGVRYGTGGKAAARKLLEDDETDEIADVSEETVEEEEEAPKQAAKPVVKKTAKQSNMDML